METVAFPISTPETAVHAILVWHSAEQLQRIEDKLDQLLAPTSQPESRVGLDPDAGTREPNQENAS